MLHMNLIGGDWVSGDAIANVKPSNTNEVVGTYARVISADTNAAIATAKAAFCSWSNSPILIRQSILSKTVQEIWARKDELGSLLACNDGKTLSEATNEIIRVRQILDFFAGGVLRL